MRIRRKRKACLNCGYPLDSDIYNYCPSCGQENTDTNISFGRLVLDFVSNVFALDSRFTNSFAPFFIKPGFLTNRFNEGKRASYASPVRLYLIISFFFFFTLGMVGKRISSEIENNGSEPKSDSVANLQFSFNATKPAESGAVPDSINARLEAQLEALDSGAVLPSAEDSLELVKANKGNSGFFGVSQEDVDTYERLKDNRRISDDMLYDSLKLEGFSTREKFLVRQYIRINRAGSQTVVDFVTKNLPLMMFLMLPVFALLLKLLYIRRKVLYVQHLIHSIHLHCFAYIAYGLCIILLLSDWTGDQLEDRILTFTFLIVSIYAFLSFKRVYRQSWLKTLAKFLLLGWAYAFCLGLGLAAEVIISFLVF